LEEAGDFINSWFLQRQFLGNPSLKWLSLACLPSLMLLWCTENFKTVNL